MISLDIKGIRAIRYVKLAPGRRIFRPLQMARQRQLLETLRYRLVSVILFIGEKLIQDPLHLLWKVLVFFPFEEDLIHYIHEEIVVISTCSTLSLYENPYVGTWITSLNSRHWPIHLIKLARLICCVIDITQQEVSSLMCCSFYILFIIFSHVPYFYRCFVLLRNYSFFTAVLLLPRTMIFGGTLFGSYN